MDRTFLKKEKKHHKKKHHHQINSDDSGSNSSKNDIETLKKKSKLLRKQEKKLQEKERVQESPPQQQQPYLDDVIEKEVGSSETSLPPPTSVPSPVANVPPPPSVVPEQIVSMKIKKAPIMAHPDDELLEASQPIQQQEVKESEPLKETTVSVAEVLQAGGQDKKKKKGRRAGSGDFGAAYHELYTQLCARMLNRIYRYFQRLYSSSKSEKSFKSSLALIQKWNQTEINRRAKEILQLYPDTEQYFRFAYAANVMLMSVVIQKDEDSEDIEIDVPKFSLFVQKAYVESARVLYDNVGVLDPSLPDRDRLRIREELFRCFGNSIATALRMMVPLEKIAPKYESRETYDSDGESIDSTVSSESEESESEESEESESDESEESESEESEESDSEEDEEESDSEEDDEESDSENEAESGLSEDSEEEKEIIRKKLKKLEEEKKLLKKKNDRLSYF